MPLPNNYNLDNAFRLAGFTTGRPVGEQPPTGRAVAAGWPLLVSLFDDDMVGLLVIEAEKYAPLPTDSTPSLTFDKALAAMFLETCMTARITPLGRLLEVGEQVLGNHQVIFEPGENAVRLMAHNIRRLRSNMVVTAPSTGSPSTGTDLAAQVDSNTRFLATITGRITDIVERLVPAWARQARPPTGVDQTARDSAAANTNFLSTFTERVNLLIMGLVPSWARQPNPPPSNDATARAAAAANTNFLSTFSNRVTAIVERLVPAWARNSQPPDPVDQEARDSAAANTAFLSTFTARVTTIVERLVPS